MAVPPRCPATATINEAPTLLTAAYIRGMLVSLTAVVYSWMLVIQHRSGLSIDCKLARRSVDPQPATRCLAARIIYVTGARPIQPLHQSLSSTVPTNAFVLKHFELTLRSSKSALLVTPSRPKYHSILFQKWQNGLRARIACKRNTIVVLQDGDRDTWSAIILTLQIPLDPSQGDRDPSGVH